VVLARFGEEIDGFLELDVDGPAGTVIDIVYDELVIDGRLPGAVGDHYSFVDRWVLRGGSQRIGSELHERGFRVVQLVIRDADAPVTISGVRGQVREYPFPDPAAFEASDPALSSVWRACLRTIQNCATDTFVDCPWRENALYLNDLVVESVVAAQGFGDGRLTARCLRLAASQVAPDGLIPAPVPYGRTPGVDEGRSARRMSFPSAHRRPGPGR
jgi:hypothetical protein